MGFSLREIMAARPLSPTSVGRHLCAADHGPAERTVARSAEILSRLIEQPIFGSDGGWLPRTGEHGRSPRGSRLTVRLRPEIVRVTDPGRRMWSTPKLNRQALRCDQ